MVSVLTYKAQGLAMPRQEVQELDRKIARVFRHKCGLPAQFPTALLRAKAWYGLQSLATRVEADAATLVMRCWNGAGHPVFAKAMEFLIAATHHHLKSPLIRYQHHGTHTHAYIFNGRAGHPAFCIMFLFPF